MRKNGAGDGDRTRNIQLGKLKLNECLYRWRKRAQSYSIPTFAVRFAVKSPTQRNSLILQNLSKRLTATLKLQWGHLEDCPFELSRFILSISNRSALGVSNRLMLSYSGAVLYAGIPCSIVSAPHFDPHFHS